MRGVVATNGAAFALIMMLALVLPGLTYAADIVIEGAHEYTEDLHIAPGEVVRVRPGSMLRFASGVGIKVEGVLDIGGPEDMVLLSPSGKSWAGIASAPGGNVRLDNVMIADSDEAVKMSGGTLTVKSVSILRGGDGIILETMADAEIGKTSFSGVSGAGLSLRQGARATVTGSAFKGPGKTGIKVTGRCSLDVSGTELSGLGKAVRSTYPGARPRLEGCRISDNEYGLYSEYPDSGALADGCVISGNIYGVYAKKMSSPSVTGGRIVSNKHGLYATEGATPKVEGALISGNEFGVYVTFSSYPSVNRCEFSGNTGYAVYLDEQSYEWVKSSGDDTRRHNMGMRAAAAGGSSGKPDRSGGGTDREKAMAAERYVNPKGAYVDFRENYWGPDTTAEMAGSGGLADTKAIYDFFDLNSDIYEGSRWVRDKADYSGYLKASPLKR